MVTNPKYSFIEFNSELDDCGCSHLIEVADASDLCFPVQVTAEDNVAPPNRATVYICNISGDQIVEVTEYVNWLTQFDQWISLDINLEEYLACKDCFRIMIQVHRLGKYYSNPIMYNPDTKDPLVSFRSRIKTYFPFEDDLSYSLRLPIELINKNPKTETEEYIDANGVIHNPYKLRRDVYDLNVNYSSVEFHKKIQVMLMHDVTMDDIQVNETGDYQIDYEESIFDNGTYLYRASTEVSEQDILLMRNY